MRATNLVRTLALLVSSLSYVMLQAQPGTIATETFFDVSGAQQMKISPDGKHLAFALAGDQDGSLVILRLADREVVAGFNTARNRVIGEFHWVNDERIIFSPHLFQGGYNSPFFSGEIFALNIDNTQKFQLVGYGVGDGGVFTLSHLLPDKNRQVRLNRQVVRRRSISRSRPESFLVDVYSKPNRPGRRQANLRQGVRSPLPWGSLQSDNAGEVRVASSNNEENLAEVRFRAEPGGDWLDISAKLSASAGQRIEDFTFLGFSRDNASFFYLTYGDQGKNSLFRYDSASDSNQLVFQHDDYDIYASNLVYSNANDQVIGVKIIGDVLESYYFEEHPDVDLRKALDAAFPGELVKITSFSRDGSKAIVEVRGPQRAGDFFLLDTAEMNIEPAIAGNLNLPVERMAEVVPFAVDSPDGLKIHGYATLPRNSSDPLPTIVLPHGGPIGVRDFPAFNREAQFFAHHGYAVLHINFRGSGGYGKEFEEAGNLQWGTGILDDIDLVARWAVQAGIAERDEMCILGGSFGAYAALASVIRKPDRYQCAVGIAGVYDLTKMGRSDVPFHPGGDDYLEKTIGVDEDELRAQSPVYHADKIKVPVFLAHGGRDRRAPIFHARDLRDALDDAEVNYEWLVEPNEGHGFYLLENQVKLYDQLLAFMNEHLK